MRFRRTGSLSVLTVLASLAAAPAARGAAVVTEAAGANAAAIQASVDSFRAALGTNNGVGGTFASGRREVNWDGVPLASQNPFPGSFFNATSPRGLVLSTPGVRLQVSGDCPGAACRLDDVTAPVGYSGSGEFDSFSSQRLFAPISSTYTTATFFVPGTSTTATVSGFGAVFCDVETAEGSSIEFYGPGGVFLYSRFVLVSGTSQKGFSFLGVRFDAGERIASVRIKSGIGPLNLSGATDVVALDDFIYGEPRPDTSLYLQAGRFKVEVGWKNPYDGGTMGVGTGTQLTNDAGTFWFFNASNAELIVKVLDGRTTNGKFWVAYGAVSDVEYTVTVTDTQTGAVKTYHNDPYKLGNVFDTLAF